MNRIKLLREERGMTQSELGKLLNVKDAAISKYESEKVPLTTETILKLADVFSVSTDYLLCYSDSRSAVSLPLKETYSSIKNCITKANYSYEEISVLLGISTKELMDIICNKSMPSLEVLAKLSELCGVSTDYILGIRTESRNADLDGIIPFRYNPKIAERINSLIDKNNQSPQTTHSILAEILSMSEDEFYNLIAYGFIPHIETIIKLATYFGVSTDYLLCLSDERDDNCIKAFRSLSNDNKDIIIGKVKELLKEQRYEESVAADKSLKEAK